ncbi:hypothetical protein BB560_004009 [Smittium megazygosporum]|uniref:Uncharacterized protein n=1 Tax=Smittium megazygosporum TaxID=133381 RepID=A0A2T9ZAI3_9FUNG|nr:hypothetical protein BB560_004009 [Smittium megazygosporum]
MDNGKQAEYQEHTDEGLASSINSDTSTEQDVWKLDLEYIEAYVKLLESEQLKMDKSLEIDYASFTKEEIWEIKHKIELNLSGVLNITVESTEILLHSFKWNQIQLLLGVIQEGEAFFEKREEYFAKYNLF